MGSINKPDVIADYIVHDDGFLRALAEYERELKSKFNVSSDARTKVKMMRERFEFIRKATVEFVEQGSLKVSRIDITADKVIRNLPGFPQHNPMIGNVPGVEIGDTFVFRVELAHVGLHGPLRGGIGTTRDGSGVLVAVSIVASGRYPDELSSSGELVYTGSGGKLAGKKDDENQKLERGNLGLKNCIETRTPVRVIYGLKSRGKGSHPRPKGASSFIYDGLYHVVGCLKEGQAGAKVYKFKLQRIHGQPQLRYCSKTGIICRRSNN
jgi:euchromatic histone-lysine N-methyltransferase